MKRLLGNALERKTAVPCRAENRADRVFLRTRCRRDVTCVLVPGFMPTGYFINARAEQIATVIRREPADPR
jgi:hypothetical protein